MRSDPSAHAEHSSQPLRHKRGRLGEISHHTAEKRPEMDTAYLAPDFAQPDIQGRTVRLSDFRGLKHVVLVFNRGFV